MSKTAKILLFSASIFLLYVSFADAQVQIDEPSWQGLVPCGRVTGIAGETSPCTLCHFILGFQRLVQYGLYMVTTLAFVGIFLAGVTYTISSGSSEMVTTAKRFLTGTLTGFAIVLGAWFIINITLWAVAAKGNLGIERAQSWWQFKCSIANSIPGQNYENLPGDVFETDEAARAFLEAKGNDIKINKAKCNSESQTDCTDLKGLPKKTADAIISIKKACKCEVVITGGTEAGHKSHGEGKPIVDLRWNDKDSLFILGNKNKFGIKRALCPIAKNPTNGCNGYEKLTVPHLHVEFVN